MIGSLSRAAGLKMALSAAPGPNHTTRRDDEEKRNARQQFRRSGIAEVNEPGHEPGKGPQQEHKGCRGD